MVPIRKKFDARNREAGTPAENKDIVQGSMGLLQHVLGERDILKIGGR
jgi:hypothetical protein